MGATLELVAVTTPKNLAMRVVQMMLALMNCLGLLQTLAWAFRLRRRLRLRNGTAAGELFPIR